MCGISGKVFFDRSRGVDPGDIVRMSRTLVHRGPDGEGVWCDRNVGLAHRRLAILDLREVANQPMCNEDQTIWVTFNGEIYNFQELRQVLESQGHVFRTTSDTEVIVHAYEEYGRQCVDHFRGMFAFALWDTRNKTLFMARDRVGKKPLYYFVGREGLVFGSEIKALLADPMVPRTPDFVALDHFLALQYIPAPLTAFQGIRKLPAAHWLEMRDGHIRIERYWKLRYTPKRCVTLSEALEEFRMQMAQAVKLRMISDVPLGAFLSGGVDSSAVVMAMSKESRSPLKTFCVGFENAAFDERQYAKMVADRCGTDHTELLVTAPVKEILPRLIWHYDEPLGDSSAVPSYAIAELTRQHVTVVLNGDGGDELFAGYDRYLTDRLIRYGDGIPLSVRRYLNHLCQHMPESWRQRGPFRKISRIARVMAQEPGRRYARWGAHFASEERSRLYSPDFKTAVMASDPEGLFVDVFAGTDAEHCIDSALDADVQLYLADDLLVKMDRASMAHSLEARSPFLDHVLMEYVASLPVEMKLRGNRKKYLLKQSLRGQVPDETLDRPKMGFSVPLASWFRHDLREMLSDTLGSSRTRQRGYFLTKEVDRLIREHSDGSEDHSLKLWDLLILELWEEMFIDGDIPDTQPVTLSGVSLGASVV